MQSEHRGSLVASVSRSIRGLLGRLTGVFLLLALSPLVIASVLILHNGQAALEENIGLQLSAQAEHIAESLDHLRANSQASLKDWAKLSVMHDLNEGDAGGRITETLTALVQGQPVWISLMAISPGGKVVAAGLPHRIGESVADQSWFQHKPTDPHLKWQPFQWKTQEGGYYFVAPIFREGKSRSLIGYLSAFLSPAQLDDHVRGILSPLSVRSDGAQGSVLLFNDPVGMLFLSQPEPAQRLSPVAHDLFPQDWLQNLQERQSSMPSPLRTWAILTAKDGRQFLVGHTGEQGRPRAGNFVGVARPLDQAYEPIYKLQRQIVGIGLVLAVLASALAIFVATRLGRPIEQLTKSAEAVASGDFAPNRLPIWRQDEIGSLARTFDRMREDLQLFTKGLEERVQARTAELESVNLQLQGQHAFLRQVLDMNPNFIFAKDRDGRFTLANLAVADAYGTSVDTLVGRTDADFSARADEAERIHRDDLAVVEKGQEQVIAEEALTDATGKVRWLRTVKRPLVGPDGRHDQVLSVAVDITALREALHAVRLSEQRFHQMVGQ
ncbi:MAG: PAS domain-containing protein, partial [Nitrospira sp.]|nr:PAS domain-containing protein [Nitrospira sp.]